MTYHINDELILKALMLQDTTKGTSISPGVIIGVAIGCAFLVLGLIGVGIYAIWQNKRAEKAIGLSRPFGKCC